MAQRYYHPKEEEEVFRGDLTMFKLMKEDANKLIFQCPHSTTNFNLIFRKFEFSTPVYWLANCEECYTRMMSGL